MRALASRHSLVAASVFCAGFAVALTSAPRDANACGGCFSPSQTVQIVTDHRMVMAVHANEAYLWDQFRYTGNPADFAWVLPVSGDVQVDVASERFFDELEAGTAVRVQGPYISTTCGGGGPTLFGASGPAGSADRASEDAGVTIISQQTVGPYETVTLRSTDAMALTTWLQGHNYAIPTSIQPVIQFYIDRHTDFVALRLSPGEGIQAMQPIRIRYASANVTLPLRMVSAGVGDKVGITLWVFASGRMEAMNYDNATINGADLTWNWDTNSSDYTQVFDRTLLATSNGRAWITEGSQPMYAFGIYGGAGESAQDWQLATGNGTAQWITRMRSDLLARFLDGDLVLQASTSNATVPNRLQTTRETGTRPVPNCPASATIGGGGTTFACDTTRAGGGRSLTWPAGVAVTLGAAITALVSRKRARAARSAARR